MAGLLEDQGIFRSLLEELPVGIYVVDREQRIRFWNRGAQQITGHLAHELVGQHDTGHLLKPCDRQGRLLCDEHSPVVATLRHGHSQQFFAFYLHKNGHRVAVKVRIRPILEHGDAVVGALNLFEEAFSFRDDAFGPLMYGCLDATTGVPSQRLTHAVLEQCITGMEETHSGFGLLRVRILGLQEFGSKHGPQSMAPFLRATAQTLRHNLDADSFLGRWGEDQFVAVLPSSSPVLVAAAAERIRKLLSQSEISWWGDHFRIEAEVESAVARPGDTLGTLLHEIAPVRARAAATTGTDGAPGSAPSQG
ncbi:MAG TPA: diguanylate cyclase [Terriglobales bacterium]|nr:diguanylate cyclase [Terriglobales bacterium]